MISWFLRVIERIQKTRKSRVRRTTRKDRIQSRLLKNKTKKSVRKRKLKKEQIKHRLIQGLRIAVQTIETFILWLIGIIGVKIIIIAVIGGIAFSLLFTLVTNIDPNDITSDITAPTEGSGQKLRGTLRFTIEEFNKYKDFLTKKEQNIFKIAILTRDSVNGYGLDNKYRTLNGRDVEDLMFKMSLGVQTTESSWIMYTTEAKMSQNDVFVDASDYDYVDDIQGPYQMGSAWTMENSIYSKEIKDKIRKMYPNPTNASERHYYPYATAISVSGTYNKMGEQGLNTAKYKDIFKRLAPDFGITSDYERFETETVVMLMQTAYLSAPGPNEREGICAALAGIWAMSSEDPDKRSYDNYRLDFSEGLSLTELNHQQFLGTGSNDKFSIGMLKSKGDLRELKLGTRKTIELNGEKLSKPLIGEVVTKYWEIPEIQKYSRDAISYANHPSRTEQQFVLKAIYGIESYLVGKQIVEYIASKLPIEVVNIKRGEFKETPGVGQGNWGGKTIEELSQGNRHAMQFKPYWGTSYAVKTGSMKEWQEASRWGVPFYYQASLENHKVKYGVINWHNSKGKLNACAYYMSAYIASALTGDLINSPEMASALIATGGVTSTGLYRNDDARVTFDLLGINFRRFYEGTTPEVLESFGLKIKDENKLWTDRWYYIDEVLASGGIVGVSVDGTSVFTANGHYMVITGKEASGKYSVYSSSNVNHTKTLYGRDAFDGKLRFHKYFLAKLKEEEAINEEGVN